MQNTTIAVDLAKSVFEVAVSHHPGQASERTRLSRARFLEFFADGYRVVLSAGDRLKPRGDNGLNRAEHRDKQI